MKNLLDTSILMGGKVNEGIVTYPVIKELDGLKGNDGLSGKQARDAIHEIHHNPSKYIQTYVETIEGEKVDDFLIRYAKENNLKLQTLDLSLALKAETLSCQTNFAYNGKKQYTGITYLTDEECAEIKSQQFRTPMPINHFFIHGKQAFIQTEEGVEEVSYHVLKNNGRGEEIKPRNVEQYCLFELFRRKVPVIMVAGKYGTGKSFSLLNHALKQLDDGVINKIVVIPNNSSLDSTMELAALPGGIWEKVAPYTNVLLDMLPLYEIEELIGREKIEVIPMAVLRGRNLEDCVIWASESQNLHEEHIKLLLGRVGKGTQLLIDCDPIQSDKRIFSTKSGIRLLSRLSETDSCDLFGMVTLEKIERSRVAQLASKLSELE